MTAHHPRKSPNNKALAPTAGAALSAVLSVTLTGLPVSTLTPAPAVGTAWTFGNQMRLLAILLAVVPVVTCGEESYFFFCCRQGL